MPACPWMCRDIEVGRFVIYPSVVTVVLGGELGSSDNRLLGDGDEGQQQ